MATLEKREQTPGNITYRVRWWADGRQRSKSFRNFADARRWKAVLEGDLVNGSYVDPKDGQVTVWSFITANRSTLLNDLRTSTRVRVEGIYEGHLKEEFGSLPLTAVTTPLVQAWVEKMKLTHSASSVRKTAFVLSGVFTLALSHGLIKANPVAAVRLPAEVKREQRFLTHDETWTLAESIVPRFRAMVLVAVFGGLRAGEIAALRRGHINVSRATVSVRQTLVDAGGAVTFGPPKTKASLRVVTLPRSIMAELSAHMDAYTGAAEDALVFTGERGVAVRRSWYFRYYWKPAVEKAGLTGLRFHDLRHTFVALWVDLGRNPKEVSRAAGHSSVAFTLDRYGHLYDTDADSLADELDAMLGLTRPHGAALDAPKGPLLSASEGNPKPFHGGSTGSNPVGGAPSSPADKPFETPSDGDDSGPSRTHQDTE